MVSTSRLKAAESFAERKHLPLKDFLKIFFKEENTYHKISKKIKSDLNQVYEYLEENKKVLKELEHIKETILENEKRIHSMENNIFKKVNVNFEEKVKLLTEIFNQTMSNISSKLNHKMNQLEKDHSSSSLHQDLLENLEKKINKTSLDKNNFEIKYNKEKNEIELYYFQELITSTKLNIKGLIGPRGPQGPQGDKGDLTIIRKINIEPDHKLKFTLQNGKHVYELNTENSLPQGPQGIQGHKGEKGEPGQINVNIKWDQNDVMKINKEHNDSLIFLKSLCIGEQSHCLKNNSLSIGGGICYKDNSISIGNQAKTFDSNSMAFCGSTLGKNAISYFSGRDPAFAVIGDLIAGWDTPEQLQAYCMTGGGKEMLQKIYDGLKATAGKIHVIGCSPYSKEALVSKNKITTVAGLKGVKIRSPEGLAAEVFRLVGAAPSSLPFSEVYT